MRIRKFVLLATAMAVPAGGPALSAPIVPAPDAPPVTAQMSATYFTNVAGSSEALATARGLKRVDEAFSPALDLNLVEPLGGISLFLTGQAGYNFYARNTELNSESLNLQGGAKTRLSVCDATASGGWARSQSNPADLIVGTTKNIQQLLSTELDATCSELGEIVPSASVSESWSTNSSSFYNLQDYRSFGASGSLAYGREPIGTISLIGQYVQTTYPHRFVAGGIQHDGYDLYSGGVRVAHSFGEALNINASVSETSLSDNSVGQNFNGVTYDASVGYRPTARLSFNLAVDRQVNPGSYLNSPYDLSGLNLSQATDPALVLSQTYTGQALNASYSVNETYSGQVSYRVTSRLTASLGASDIESTYKGADLLAASQITAQTFKSFYGALAFNASPTFSLSLNAGQDQRHANLPGYSYAGAHVGISASKSF